MAKYIIRVWDVAAIIKHCEITKGTAASAWLAFDRAVYDVLEAFGKLDTVAAHVAMGKSKALRDILPVGDQRAITVSNTGKSVVISRIS